MRGLTVYHYEKIQTTIANGSQIRCYRLGRRRITASSRSKGRLVAPRMRILWLSFDLSPSQAAMNSFLILLVASCSEEPPRAPNRLSIYQINKNPRQSQLLIIKYLLRASITAIESDNHKPVQVNYGRNKENEI